jgi:antitoxin MazE
MINSPNIDHRFSKCYNFDITFKEAFMSVKLRNIGHSRGVIIPKALIEQAGLEGYELTFIPMENGLLIKPVKKAREGWAEQIAAVVKAQGQDIDHEWLDSKLTDDDFDWSDDPTSGVNHDK